MASMATGRQTWCWGRTRNLISLAANREERGRGGEAGNPWAFEISKTIPSDTDPSTRPHLLSLYK